jgi:hypothetical protein
MVMAPVLEVRLAAPWVWIVPVVMFPCASRVKVPVPEFIEPGVLILPAEEVMATFPAPVALRDVLTSMLSLALRVISPPELLLRLFEVIAPWLAVRWIKPLSTVADAEAFIVILPALALRSTFPEPLVIKAAFWVRLVPLNVRFPLPAVEKSAPVPWVRFVPALRVKSPPPEEIESLTVMEPEVAVRVRDPWVFISSVIRSSPAVRVILAVGSVLISMEESAPMLRSAPAVREMEPLLVVIDEFCTIFELAALSVIFPSADCSDP